jgi:hypothetical protein
MQEWTIKFDCERKPLTIKGATFAKAVEEYLKTNKFLDHAILVGADLSGAELANADFTGADLSYANLSHANLINADLSYTNLFKADLSYTILSNAILSNADLRNADLRNADLTNAALSYANLTDSDLSHADLSHADLSYSDLGHVYLSHAILIGANLDFSSLPLNCGSLKMQIDKRIACQLLYHTLSAMQSVDDEEVKAILNDDKVLALANQFHRVDECGSIVKEQPNA